MRGVVSLATALSIPILMADGSAFPFRNLIIFITFVVIFVTLIIQGLTLPLIIKWIGIEEIDELASEDQQQAGIKLRLHNVALTIIDTHYPEAAKENELVISLQNDIKNDVWSTSMRIESLECNEMKRHEIVLYHEILAKIYRQQRHELFLMRKEKNYSDSEIRKAEMQLDLDDTKIGGGFH